MIVEVVEYVVVGSRVAPTRAAQIQVRDAAAQYYPSRVLDALTGRLLHSNLAVPLLTF